MSTANPKHMATCGCSMCRYLEAVSNLAAPCDDCTEEPCVCDPLWKWITDRVRESHGYVAFCVTENGQIGVFLDSSESAKSVGGGDTAEDAVASAIAKPATADKVLIATITDLRNQLRADTQETAP